MRIVMNTQVRLTEFKTSLARDIFIESLKTDKNYIILNDNSIFIWDYLNVLENERVFNSFCIIDNITLLVDSETQTYEAYRDGRRFDHIIFKDMTRWIKIKYDKDNRRLLRKMKLFRENLLNHELESLYYRGIYSDRFSIMIKDREVLIISWNSADDNKLLGVEENFSFFLKICKLIL